MTDLWRIYDGLWQIWRINFFSEFCVWGGGDLWNDDIVHSSLFMINYLLIYPKYSSSFNRKDKLTRHLYSHSKVKPFKCEQCDKSFARTDNLREHIRSHTGIQSWTNAGKIFCGFQKWAKRTIFSRGENNEAEATRWGVCWGAAPGGIFRIFVLENV